MYTPSDWDRRHKVATSTSLPEESYRSPVRRDYARLIHSPAFRRLQGKTQLFPGIESDYFRNRLTHSLEVAQIAKSIAIKLNATVAQLRRNPIDVDIVEFAGLCHDLGHPPFGHQGEYALDALMLEEGGFEGNAQTLRIIARLEKRQRGCEHESGIADTGLDERFGLNLCARTYAAILKYDSAIPISNVNRSKPYAVSKGYYESESDLVRWIKSRVAPRLRGRFKTVECQIMDVADDIAYSTYDLEDTFKAGFFGPLDLLCAVPIFENVAQKVSTATGSPVSRNDIEAVLKDTFSELFDGATPGLDAVQTSSVAHIASNLLQQNGYLRSALTSRLIRKAIEGVQLTFNERYPALSEVTLRPAARLTVEVLKHFTYELTIQSPRVAVSQFRAREIIATIFNALSDDPKLLPDDVRVAHSRISADQKRRLICDFIAGMTDRYAVEFYGRIKSVNPQTIFKPI